MPLNGPDDVILNQIIYRGEGNSSIVVALKAQAKVIRLLKKDGKIMKFSQDHHATQHPMRCIKFIHLIMKPLTDPFLSGSTELVHLKSSFINLLSKQVEAERPLHRLDKTLHLDDQYALIMNDLCVLPVHLTRQLSNTDLCGPTISIEIKPKQGFLPIHRFLMKPSANDQLVNGLKNCCLYGLTQPLKLARGRIEEMSNYCPINLFSGCPVKMKNALENLLKNPQNNLRIFKDLVLAFGESNQSVKLSSVFENFFTPEEPDERTNHTSRFSLNLSHEERLIELIIQCLLHENNDKVSEQLVNSKDNENTFINNDGCLQHSPNAKCRRCDMSPSVKKHKSTEAIMNSTHKLPRYCVLSSVLRAQKLDTIGAHEANYMLEWLLNDQKSSVADNKDVLEELSKPQVPLGFGLPYQLVQETKRDYYFRKVWEFLVSLTAKDCSIIITMRKISKSNHDQLVRDKPSIRNHLLKEHRSEIYYMFNVGIADLDQKMPLKIPRICENLNQVVSIKLK